MMILIRTACFQRQVKQKLRYFRSLTSLSSSTTSGSISQCKKGSLSSSNSIPQLQNLLQNPSVLLPPYLLDITDDEDARQQQQSNSNEVRTKKYMTVYNPADGTVITPYVPVMDRSRVQDCIHASNDALQEWRYGTTGMQRANVLQKWNALIGQYKEDIAKVISYESGKPIQESYNEILYGQSYLEYAAADAVRPYGANGGFIIPTPFLTETTNNSTTCSVPKGQLMAIQQAVGVAAIITPWNFPFAMITRKVGPALAAGCTVLVKPSELTPLTAILLQNLAIQAGIPENGVYQTITTDTVNTPDVGHEFCTNPLVRKVSFTGSTSVGKQLMKLSSSTVKRLSLELGGNAPFIVFDDADLDVAVNAAYVSKFRNAGQTCVSSDRFLLQEGIHDEFLRKLEQLITNNIRIIGPGIHPETNLGPLISMRAVQTMHQKVIQAIERDGAICILGGKPTNGTDSCNRNDDDNYNDCRYYEPTILINVDCCMSDIWKTETFGPVIAIRKFSTEEEALHIASDTRYGLASYFCTKDLSRVHRLSQQIESGMVAINEGILSTCVAPFGGIKESGFGREGSPLGIAEYLETKYILTNY